MHQQTTASDASLVRYTSNALAALCSLLLQVDSMLFVPNLSTLFCNRRLQPQPSIPFWQLLLTQCTEVVTLVFTHDPQA